MKAAFANDYRRLVVPRLQAEIDKQGWLLAAIEERTFSDAFGEVWGKASRLGAHHLPTQLQLDLEDHISTALLEAVDVADPKVRALAAEIEERRQADPVGHYAALAAQCSQPMEWVFAAISPEYRTHLIAERRGGR